MRSITKILLCVVVLGAVCAAAGPACAMTRDEAIAGFVEGNEHYKRGQYGQAADSFEAVVSGGWESGEVYYNLGNTYYKLGRLGESILAYERALRLMPRDPDLLANWRLARSRVENHAGTAVHGFWQRLLEREVRSYSMGELASAFLILLALLLAVHLLSLFLRMPLGRSRALIFSVLALWIVVSALFTFKIFSGRNMAVVLESTESRFEPMDQATVHYRLSEGQKVRIVKREGLWRKVRRGDGKEGWVEKDKVEKIVKGRS